MATNFHTGSIDTWKAVVSVIIHIISPSRKTPFLIKCFIGIEPGKCLPRRLQRKLESEHCQYVICSFTCTDDEFRGFDGLLVCFNRYFSMSRADVIDGRMVEKSGTLLSGKVMVCLYTPFTNYITGFRFITTHQIICYFKPFPSSIHVMCSHLFKP